MIRRFLQLFQVLQLCICCLLANKAFAVDLDEQILEQRIKPFGANRTEQSLANNTNINSTNIHINQVSSLSGESIYQQHCSICHANGVAGAPKYRDPKDWADRLKQKKLEELIQSVTNGFNAMPPKGTCQECEHDDFKNAIEYMLPPSP